MYNVYYTFYIKYVTVFNMRYIHRTIFNAGRNLNNLLRTVYGVYCKPLHSLYSVFIIMNTLYSESNGLQYTPYNIYIRSSAVYVRHFPRL